MSGVGGAGVFPRGRGRRARSPRGCHRRHRAARSIV